jgi:adenylate cyclase
MVEERTQRRLVAILAADVVGYSRLMGKDEAGTLKALMVIRAEVIDPKIAEHSGRVFKSTGDGVLSEFPSVVNAVACAAEIQSVLVAQNSTLSVRIGINVGDVIVEQGDLFGDAVNIAARLESLAPASGILISGSARDQLSNRLDLQFDDIGEQTLKNIERPVRAYLVRAGSGDQRSVSAIASDKPSIALLPFVNLSKDPEQDSLADGITENVIMGLSRFRDLFVIASSSTFAFKGKAVKVQEASRELGARYILEGSVQRSKDRVRITAQLVDGRTGRHLWAERYDRSIDDLFAVQDEVTEQIIGSLATAYGGRLIKAWHDRPERTGTRDSQALDYFIRGMDSLNRTTKDDNLQAREFFKRAGELDPRFGKAFAKRAWTFLNEATEGWSEDPDASLEHALEFAQLAIERDDAEAWGHYALAGYSLYRKDFDRCIAEFRRALDLNPNDPDVLTDFGYALSYAGRSSEALEASLKGKRLNPFHPEWYVPLLGQVYYDAGRYEEAISTLESVRQIDTVYLRMYLAASHIALGHYADAQKSVQRAMEIDRDASIRKVTSAEMAPYKNLADLERFREHLRKAGLPE